VFVWVDPAPDARSARDTEYVLVSAAGARVVRGKWGPVLNGRELFTAGAKPCAVGFPVQLPGK
jgi:hypothetical protein